MAPASALDRLRRGLGSPKPPATISQQPFEGNPAHLNRLRDLAPDAMLDARDLSSYTEDVHYGSTEIQADLLRWVLPYRLRAWADDLRGRTSEYAGFVEHFYPALAHEKVSGSLTESERCAVAAFMREGLLEEIDEQQGLSYSGMGARPYRWIHAHRSYGALFPQIDDLWAEWWSMSSRGRAVAAIQYVSCLVYGDNENPVFEAWTGDAGGGPPCLWEYSGHMYSHRWLEPNVRFLAGFLKPSNVLDHVRRAVAVLSATPEASIAEQVLRDALDRTAVLASRCAEPPKILADKGANSVSHAWSS
jgi:hypothetical protein